MSHSADLVVLGAGPAGLAAAWRASRSGLSTVVLERASAVGGMAGSFTVAGTRVDFGSHRLHPATAPALLADLQALLGGDLALRRRNGRLRVAGRWVGFPLRPGELARTLPPQLLARVLAEGLIGPLTGPLTRARRRTSPSSYANVLRAGLGPTLYDSLYGPYARKLWGLPGEAIDAEQARRRVTADTVWKVAGRMLAPRRRTGQGRSFFYPVRGFGQIVEALSTAATRAGADIRLGQEVSSLTASPDHVTLRTSGGGPFTAGQVFSTIPLPVLGRLARPAPAAQVLTAAAGLRLRAMLLVYVVHEGGRWTSFDAHYVPDPATPITRISEPANYRDSPSDPVGSTVLCCEIPCDVGDRMWTASEADLVELVADAVSRVGLPPLRVLGLEVRRLPRVYPVYSLGYRADLQGIEAWADALPRVTTFGRLGMFAHDNTHHAMGMAYDAVDALRDGVVDADAWQSARRRFATHVVED
ncbi:MAG: FAD-dependent oxidoreductase [Actinomycetota bacterium]|nr:FAD-dependent oxidoreductase [Actinomycetota bacterium]